MKRTLAAPFLLLLFFCTSCPSIQMQEWQETMVVKLRVTALVTEVPKGAQQIRLWVPAPITVPGLELRSPLAVSAGGADFVERSDGQGDRYLFLEARPETGKTISFEYEVTLACSSLPPPATDGSTSGLWESHPMELSGDQKLLTRIRKKALIVTAEHPTWFGKAKALAAWLLREHREGPQQGLTLSFEKMRGDSMDLHRIYTTACQTLGIPARIDAGFALPSGEGLQPVDQVLIWAMVQIPGMDWIPVDLRDAQLRPEGWENRFGGLQQARIRMASGEQPVLDPPTQERHPGLFLRPRAECDGRLWTGLNVSITVEKTKDEES